MEIAYRGERPDHDFVVDWGPCRNANVVGRLIDLQGKEPARRDFHVARSISLDALPCRPAVVTLRLGRVSHLSVRVPPGG